MTGHWIAVTARPEVHVCKLPWLIGRRVGRVWQCECGAAHVVRIIGDWGDGGTKIWSRLSGSELRTILEGKPLPERTC